jgi:hypothetical protein
MNGHGLFLISHSNWFAIVVCRAFDVNLQPQREERRGEERRVMAAAAI